MTTTDTHQLIFYNCMMEITTLHLLESISTSSLLLILTPFLHLVFPLMPNCIYTLFTCFVCPIYYFLCKLIAHSHSCNIHINEASMNLLLMSGLSNYHLGSATQVRHQQGHAMLLPALVHVPAVSVCSCSTDALFHHLNPPGEVIHHGCSQTAVM